MRTPSNEKLNRPDIDSVVPASGRDDGDHAAHESVRSCVLTRDRAPRSALVRLALGPDGQIHPDVRAKAAGRGAWIGVARPELEVALAKGKLRGALARAFKTGEFVVASDLPARVEAALERAALDRLGLEARAGNVLTGSERIEKAARSGQLRALYHAADASDDGTRRLAQAWRVGSDTEGSDLRGLALPVARPILSVALGRENVVHIGVTDRAAARRLSDALGRWLQFIGSDQIPAPCGTAPQGSSAPRLSGAQPDDLGAAEVHEDTE